MNHRAATFIFILTLSSMSSCSISPEITKQAEQIVQQTQSATEQMTERDKEVMPLTRESARSWPGPQKPIRSSRQTTAIPPALHDTIEITLVEPISLRTVARFLSEHSGVQIQVAEDIQTESLPDLNWNGSVLEALDHIADRMGYRWRNTTRGVEIFHTDYGFWTLYAPAVTAKWQASVGLSGAVQSGRGGSDLQAQDQVVITADSAELWSQLESTVSTLLSTAGGASLNPQSGELVVRDTPAALARIDQWVQAKNDELSAQVEVAIEIYEIEDSTSANAGFNLSGALQNAFGKTAASVEIGSDDEGELYGLRLLHTPEEAVDASDMLLLLRQASGDGSIAKLTSTVIRGVNGMPVPVFFGDETSYLQRRDVVKDEGDVSVRLIAGQLQDGIAINLLPRVLPDSDRLMLNLTVRTTRIKGIARFPADAGPSDPVIQLPDLESRSMLLPVLLRSGEPLLVAGFDTQRSNSSQSIGLLSQSKKASASQSKLVMIITPRIIQMQFANTPYRRGPI